MTKQEQFNQEENRVLSKMDAAAEKRQALPHKFKTDYELIDLAEIVGYTTALADVTEWINKYLDYSNDTDQLKQAIRETVWELKQLNRKNTIK